MDNIITYKIHETLVSSKNNLGIKGNDVFIAYKIISEHIKVFKKNYPVLFDFIKETNNLIEKGKEIKHVILSFKTKSNQENDNIIKLAYYISVELTLILTRFYSQYSVGGGINSKILNIFDKNKFYELEEDLNKINSELRGANILIFDLNDIKYLSSKNEISKYLNIIQSLITTRKNGIKNFDILIGAIDMSSSLNEELLNQYNSILSLGKEII